MGGDPGGLSVGGGGGAGGARGPLAVGATADVSVVGTIAGASTGWSSADWALASAAVVRSTVVVAWRGDPSIGSMRLPMIIFIAMPPAIISASMAAKRIISGWGWTTCQASTAIRIGSGTAWRTRS